MIDPPPVLTVASTSPVQATIYDSSFYSKRARGSTGSADVIVPMLLKAYPAKSVVDLGCGSGSWLSVFAANGINDFQGLDGDYVNRSLLQIPKERFQAADLTKPLVLSRKFDLATSLEVGEHLPGSSAAAFVQSLVNLAPVVLFSAAIPGQTGTNHINEQWPDYWAKLFVGHGYKPYDWIRPRVWNDPNVDYWYAQNVVVYATDDAIRDHPDLAGEFRGMEGLPLSLVHPTTFLGTRHRLLAIRDRFETPGVLWTIKALAESVRSAIARHVFGVGKK